MGNASMTDTTPEALAVQTEVHRKMTPVQRLEIAFDMSLAARGVSEAGGKATFRILCR